MLGICDNIIFFIVLYLELKITKIYQKLDTYILKNASLPFSYKLGKIIYHFQISTLYIPLSIRLQTASALAF